MNLLCYPDILFFSPNITKSTQNETRYLLILVINQVDALISFSFTINLFHAFKCFEHYVLIVRRSKLYYTASGIITPVGGRPVHRLREERVLSQPVHRTATYRRDDTRGCIVQFCPPDDEHMCSKHVEAWNKLIIKFSASSWLILINKYIEMLSQQNIKICPFVL